MTFIELVVFILVLGLIAPWIFPIVFTLILTVLVISFISWVGVFLYKVFSNFGSMLGFR